MDIVALLIAVVALVVAGVVFLQARSAEKSALLARRDAAQAFERSGAAGMESSAAVDHARTARQDAAQALNLAARAREESAASAERALAAERHVAHLAELASAPVLSRADGPEVAVAPERRDDGVRWSAEHLKGALWVMRNTGETVAHAALLTEATQPPRYIRPAEVIPRDVPPGDHLQFRLSLGRDTPPPRVRVAWRDESGGAPRAHEATLVTE